MVDFVKRLQVGVSGNLQSAAEVRATCIDLSNHSREAAEELKSLRYAAALVKHEVQSGLSSKTSVNPF
jgi:hypothetical protein